MKLKKYNLALIFMFVITAVLGVTAVIVGFRLRQRETVTPEEPQAATTTGGEVEDDGGGATISGAYGPGEIVSICGRGCPPSSHDFEGRDSCWDVHDGDKHPNNKCYSDRCSVESGDFNSTNPVCGWSVQVSKCLATDTGKYDDCNCTKAIDWVQLASYDAYFNTQDDPDTGIPNDCFMIQLDVVEEQEGPPNCNDKHPFDWVVWKGGRFGDTSEYCAPDEEYVCGDSGCTIGESCSDGTTCVDADNNGSGECCNDCGGGVYACDSANGCTCLSPECGDGICDMSAPDNEKCEFISSSGRACQAGDDGSAPSGDAVNCRASNCTYCGDGTVDPGEECEPGDECPGDEICTDECTCPTPTEEPSCDDLLINGEAVDSIDLQIGEGKVVALEVETTNATGATFTFDSDYGTTAGGGDVPVGNWQITPEQSSQISPTPSTKADAIYVTFELSGETYGGKSTACAVDLNVEIPDLECISMSAQASSTKAVFTAVFSPSGLHIDEDRIGIGFYASDDPTKTHKGGTVESVVCDDNSTCIIEWNYPADMTGDNTAQITIDGEYPDGACAVDFNGPPPPAPLFTVAKGSTQVCIENSTQALITYSIVVRNIGDIAGDIESVTDTIDEDIDPSWVSSISDGGTLTGNVITWGGFTLGVGAEKTLTYQVTVPTEQFNNNEALLKNVVLVSPVEGEDLTYTHVTSVSCLPGVGKIDRSFLIIIVGVLLFAVGLLGVRVGVIDSVDRKKRGE